MRVLQSSFVSLLLLLFLHTLCLAEGEKPDTGQQDSTRYMVNPVVQQYNNSLTGILKTTTFLYDDFSAMLTSPFRMDKSDLLKMCGVLATFGVMFSYDQELYDAMQRNRDNRVYKKVLEVGNFFEPVGLTRNTHPYYLAGFFTGYLVHCPKMQEASVQLLESMIFEGNTRVGIMHPLFGRSRPSKDQGPYFFQLNGDRSFPSGHTSNIFQLATILSHHVDNTLFSILAYGIATTVGLQRIDYKSHWPSDVFMGAVYGITVSRGIIYLHEQRKLNVSPHVSMIENTPVLGLTFNLDSNTKK